MKITLAFKWYDLWVGLFVDAEKRRLYFCPLPCVLITVHLPAKQITS